MHVGLWLLVILNLQVRFFLFQVIRIGFFDFKRIENVVMWSIPVFGATSFPNMSHFFSKQTEQIGVFGDNREQRLDSTFQRGFMVQFGGHAAPFGSQGQYGGG